MSNFRLSSGALGALMLLTMSIPSHATGATAQASAQKKSGPAADDVPAPSMFLLFGLAAAGVIWGRRLAANARKKAESAHSE